MLHKVMAKMSDRSRPQWRYAARHSVGVLVLLLCLGVLIPAAGLAPRAHAEDGQHEIFMTPVEHLALGGYDAISYFAQPQPVMGQAEHSYVWKGATWLFSSHENMLKFRVDPSHYAPAYGGHAAWPVTVGALLRGNPVLYTLHDGRLFLHYTPDTMRKWHSDQDRLIRRADAKWAEILPTLD